MAAPSCEIAGHHPMTTRSKTAKRAERLAMYADNPETGFRPPEDCFAPKRVPVRQARRPEHTDSVMCRLWP